MFAVNKTIPALKHCLQILPETGKSGPEMDNSPGEKRGVAGTVNVALTDQCPVATPAAYRWPGREILAVGNVWFRYHFAWLRYLLLCHGTGSR